MQDAEMGGPRACAALHGGEMNLVVCGGAERVVAGLEPFEAGEGEPAVGSQKIRDMLGAPGKQVALPRGVLRESRQAEKSAEKSNCEHLGAQSSKPRSLCENTVGRHRGNYIAWPPWRASPRTRGCPPAAHFPAAVNVRLEIATAHGLHTSVESTSPVTAAASHGRRNTRSKFTLRGLES